MDDFKKAMRQLPCMACGCHGVDLHHIKSRGSGGKDTTWNLIPLCRNHHNEYHFRGWSKFLIRYQNVFDYLSELGWKIINGKLIHDDN